MPKPRVRVESKEYETTKSHEHWKPTTEAESIGSEQDLNKLSFLYGAACDGGTDDMGLDGQKYLWDGYPEGYEARRKLRRHTLDQGMSTFSFRQKR